MFNNEDNLYKRETKIKFMKSQINVNDKKKTQNFMKIILLYINFV